MVALAITPLTLFSLALVAAITGPVDAWSLDLAAGVDCPSRAVLTRALPQTPEPGAQLQLTPAEARAAPAGQTHRLRLRLIDARGVTQLERLLEVDRARCETTARAIALVIERHQRQVAWSAGGPAVPVTEVQSRPEPRPQPAHDATPAAARAAGLVMFAGPALWSRRTGAPSASVELQARVWGPLSLGLGAVLPGASSEQPLPGGGRARLSSWPLLVSARAERAPLEGRALLGHAGLDVLLHVERGESSGIATPGARTRVLLAAGPAAGLSWLPTARLRLGVAVSVSRTLAGRDFEVTGQGPVLQAPAWQGLVALRAGWVLSP